MSAHVEIPTALQSFAGNHKVVEVPDGTVARAFDKLFSDYDQLKAHLYDEQGHLRSFVNVYVNDEDIRYSKELDTEVRPGDVIRIIPSIAGGR